MASDIVDNNLDNVMFLCTEMLELADQGDRYRQDAGCGVVYGALRDAAYMIRHLAEKELLEHRDKSGASSKKTKKGRVKGKSDRASADTREGKTLKVEKHPGS